MKLLLAEDDSKLHLVIKMCLNRNGHDVTSANNAQETLELFRQEHFDGIIIDTNIPVMTGIELTKKILQSPGQPNIILLLADQSEIKEITESISSPKVHILTKPFSPSALTSLIGNRRKDTLAMSKSS